jgi:ligand-binding sensor domain-containing protein
MLINDLISGVSGNCPNAVGQVRMTHFLFRWMINFILSLIFCSYALAAGPLGDNPNFSRIPFNATDSIGEIVAISQDDLGFLWFGGRRGLARYDGYRIHTYKANPRDPTALGDDRITDLFKDSYGELWVATANAGVARLNRHRDNFFTYKIEKNEGGKSRQQNFTEMLEDEQRNLWIVGGDGIALYERAEDRFTRYLTRSPIINGAILKMLSLQADTYLLVSAEAVFIWNKNTDALEKIQPNLKENKSLPLSLTRSVLKDSKGTIWIGHDKGLYQFNPDTKTFTSIPLKNAVENIKNVTIWNIIEDKNGILWMGTDGNGLMYYDPATQSFGSYTRTVSPSSLGAPVVRTLFEDREGDLWVSTFPTGLYHYNQTNNYFAYYANFIKSKAGLYANTIWAFAEDAQQNIWLGIDSLGLVYFDRTHNRFTQTYNGFDFAEHKFPHTVLSLLQDSRGNLWMGSWAQGVTRFNPKTLEYQHYNPNLPDDTHNQGSVFEGESVWSMLEAKNGDIYFGTMNQGFIQYDHNTQQFTTYKNNHDGDKSPNNNIGWSFLEDDLGRIWVGTNNGINIFDPETKRFTYLQANPDDENSLSSNQVLALFRDSKARIWICTIGGGLNLFQPENNSFKHIDTQNGFKNKDIQAIVEDNNGLLWISNTTNITSLNPDTMQMHTYTDKSWVQNGEFSHGAA